MTEMATGVAGFRVTEDDLRDANRLAIWREVIGRQVARLDLAPLPDRRFHHEAVVRALPGLHVAVSAASGVRVARTRELVADGDDNFALLICTAGTPLSDSGRELPLAQGEAVLMTNAEVGAVVYPAFARSLCVGLPRAMLASTAHNLEDSLLRLIPRDNAATQLLIGYADALGSHQPLPTADLQRLAAAHVRDLVLAALGPASEAGAPEVSGIRAARLHAIKAEILARLGEAGLSVGTVAARQGLSPRYVQALFEAEGTTFSQFLLAQRLARAHAVLSDARNADRPIGTIAFEVGFGDLSSFNRAFRRRYDVTPSDVRAAALVNRINGATSSSSERKT